VLFLRSCNYFWRLKTLLCGKIKKTSPFCASMFEIISMMYVCMRCGRHSICITNGFCQKQTVILCWQGYHLTVLSVRVLFMHINRVTEPLWLRRNTLLNLFSNNSMNINVQWLFQNARCSLNYFKYEYIGYRLKMLKGNSVTVRLTVCAVQQ
jgi:hypothetical protein